VFDGNAAAWYTYYVIKSAKKGGVCMEGIPMAVICFVCAAVFFVVGAWADRRKTPMHFWLGSTVAPESIRDIPAYNRENAVMWCVYGLSFVGCGLAALWSMAVAGVLTMVCGLGGLFVLIFWYSRILRKYKV